MGSSRQAKSHEIDEDLEFERSEWAVQRAGWVICALILAAGFIGLLGSGPLSHVETSNGPLTLEYERFVRKLSPTVFHFRIDSSAAVDQKVGIWLDQDLVDKFDIAQIIPDPVDTEAGDGRVVYYFGVAEADPLSEITFDVQPSEPGMMRSQLGLVDGPEIDVDQLIYP
jgi:hypothetical protein